MIKVGNKGIKVSYIYVYKLFVYKLKSFISFYRIYDMSHHFVTVCVVCVLCAAHTPCSAHIEFSTSGQATHNSVNSEKSLRPNEQLQPSWSLMKFKEIQQKDARKLSLNNLDGYNNGAVKFYNVLDKNIRNKTTLLMSVATNEVHTKKKHLENVEINIQNNHIPIMKQDSKNLKDIEISERLGQFEITQNSKLNIIQFDKNQSPFNKIRTKRNDVDVLDEKYFMKKIFETYGDGTSITMEGFEKLLKKLGLLRLLTDISRLENHNIVASHNENPLGKFFHILIIYY